MKHTELSKNHSLQKSPGVWGGGVGGGGVGGVFNTWPMDSNRSDNPGNHTVHDQILDEVIETGKGQKVKAKWLKQTCRPVKRCGSKYLQNLTPGECSLLWYV